MRCEAAQTDEHLADIINIMIEELVRQRFELPGYSRFYREAIAARTRVNESCFELVNSQLRRFPILSKLNTV